MMKAFVTGATGFLGSHLVDALLEKKWEVHVLVRKTSNLQWLLGKRVHYHYGDVVGDGQGLREGLKEADFCFHLAGVIVAASSATYYEVNAQGTANVLEACWKEFQRSKKLKRVVVVTSIAAQGPSLDDRPATEEETPRPITDYGRSKRDAELIAQRYFDRLPITIIRPPALYGPRDRQFFRVFQLARYGMVLMLGAGERIASVAHVRDIVSGLLLAAEHPKAIGETFFIGAEKNERWDHISEIIGRSVRKNFVKIPIPQAFLFGVSGVAQAVGWITGKTPLLNLDQAKNFVQENWGIDIGKAKRVLGYHPRYDLKKGVSETAAWYLEELWL